MLCSPDEVLIITASRLLRDGKIVFAGVGAALQASVLARATHAPHLTIVIEGGIIGPEVAPGQLPVSTNEMRAGRKAMMLTGITDIFLLAQRGFFDYGFLGAAQIDPFGNLNSSLLGDPAQPRVKLPGTGGANDIASHCGEVFVLTRHERRRFVEQVDFVTSPGHLGSSDGRRQAGLLFGGPSHVITDLALFDFDPSTCRMRLCGLQSGTALEEVIEKTGFELKLADTIEAIPPPAPHEISALRTLVGERKWP